MTPKQRRFVEAFTGNATEAAKTAGYSQKTAYSAGARLLKHVEVARAISGRETKTLKPLIRSREEVQTFWSKMIDDEKRKDEVRLRASELLGKSRGDFVEKLEVRGELTLLDLVLDARKPE